MFAEGVATPEIIRTSVYPEYCLFDLICPSSLFLPEIRSDTRDDGGNADKGIDQQKARDCHEISAGPFAESESEATVQIRVHRR